MEVLYLTQRGHQIRGTTNIILGCHSTTRPQHELGGTILRLGIHHATQAGTSKALPGKLRVVLECLELD